MSAKNAQTLLATARLWHEIDAKDFILGRLSTRIAIALMGKYKPIYHPQTDHGDYVVVKNAEKIRLSGDKINQKVYYKHTQYPGGLKVTPIKKYLAINPTEVIRKAVYGMLPKNRLRNVRMERLKLFAGDSHPYEANITKNYIDKRLHF